jgi:hypothetical protein
MTAAGDDNLTALREQAALASAAAISARDLDHAFQLQLEEATQASIRLHPRVSSSNAASSSWTQAAPTPPEPSSDASYGEISKYNLMFVGLTSYDPQFASLSKYNPEALGLFDSGVFYHFSQFRGFVLYLASPNHVKRHFCP